MDYEAFVKDSKTAYAVIRALEIIGEASKNVPPPPSKKNIAKYLGRKWLV